MEELKVMTELVSESVETHVQLQVPSLRVFFVDDAPTIDDGREYISGTERWAVCGPLTLLRMTSSHVSASSRQMAMPSLLIYPNWKPG